MKKNLFFIFLSISLVTLLFSINLSSANLFNDIYSKITGKVVSENPYTNSNKLIWPINCTPAINCKIINYPDLNSDGIADSFPSIPSLIGHTGTDIAINFSQMDKGIPVYAELDGQVLWVFNGKYDRCQYPNTNNPDCKDPTIPNSPGSSSGYRVCTNSGPYCGSGYGSCFWCFDGGNVIVIKHNSSVIFATRYDHLKNNSILVQPGQIVTKGQKIAEVGSSGRSTEPHLHFEVWSNGYYSPIDPWNQSNYLFQNNPPYKNKYILTCQKTSKYYKPWHTTSCSSYACGKDKYLSCEKRWLGRYYYREVCQSLTTYNTACSETSTCGSDKETKRTTCA